MKILCLHGAGSNSQVLEVQLDPIRDGFDFSETFEFFDGFREVETTEDIRNIFPGPFFTWYSPGLGGHTLAEAKVDLLELIKAEGPFDACLGFSQGAALLAAVIMDHQRQHQFGPNLFQLAIFICAGAPVLVTKSLQEPQNSVDLPPIQSMAPLTEPWLGPFVPGHSPQEDESWNIFVPDSVREAGMMIRIPTAHIYGAKDSRVKESLRLRDMCDPRKRVELDHGRGHEVPRASHLVQQMKDIIRKAIDKSLTAH